VADRLYYVNMKDKFALFVGAYSVEPDPKKNVALKAWMDMYGPVNPHFIKTDTPPHYPWSDGTGGRLPGWRTWVLTGGRHTQSPSQHWQAWPTTPVQALAAFGGRK
jgi:hypothetical protein